MSSRSPDSLPSDADVRAWMEAMVVRIEDDPDLLAALSDEEVDAALADEGIRASGVRAAVRRRVREAEARPARSPARRIRFTPFRSVALAALGVIALASLWWLQQPQPFQPDDVLAYETALSEMVRPATKSAEPTVGDLLSEGAQALLTAAEGGASEQAYTAAQAFEAAYGLASSPDGQDTAAFFAGLANGLGGGIEQAATWLRRVSPDGAYGAAAREALDDLGV